MSVVCYVCAFCVGFSHTEDTTVVWMPARMKARMIEVRIIWPTEYHMANGDWLNHHHDSHRLLSNLKTLVSSIMIAS
jgi:hypothetical protein